ncbi:12810_t:CDS:1 [Cetraspora pellucida]|uniref:12810_t:CDS:1 n=1 Tax=Cetraspora pellucida TaxID=1433469 RepID=A0A9N8VMM2_9GLOM|nr:12810_t:CDS:1 [Cetraspora pellucida]
MHMRMRPPVKDVLELFGPSIEKDVKKPILEECDSADPELYVNPTMKDGHVLRQLNCWMIFKKDFHKKMTDTGLYGEICHAFNIPGKERVHMVGELVNEYWTRMTELERAPFKKLADRVKERMSSRFPNHRLRRKKRKPKLDEMFRPYLLRSDKKKKSHPKKQQTPVDHKMQDENHYLFGDPYSAYVNPFISVSEFFFV